MAMHFLKNAYEPESSKYRENENMAEYIFEVETPLEITIHTTKEYWEKILIKHPELEGRLDTVISTLKNPTEIRMSKRDELIFLFYSKNELYWLCIVTKKTGAQGFLVTAYITDRIKEGIIIWPK